MTVAKQNVDPMHAAALASQLRTLRSWADPANDDPFAVRYRECEADADRRVAAAASLPKAGSGHYLAVRT